MTSNRKPLASRNPVASWYFLLTWTFSKLKPLKLKMNMRHVSLTLACFLICPPLLLLVFGWLQSKSELKQTSSFQHVWRNGCLQHRDSEINISKMEYCKIGDVLQELSLLHLYTKTNISRISEFSKWPSTTTIPYSKSDSIGFSQFW